MRRIATTLWTLTLVILVGLASARADEITVTDSDVEGDVVWTADDTYLLDGFVFVEDGSSLTIEAGTVIKGMPGSGEDASALIVARGGKIFAEGTATDPIIFTAETDDLSATDDLPLSARGLWGGVILLGDAPVNEPGGEAHIEGIPESEPRGSYGGTNADHSAGIFRYVSIRHGGSNIGAGNEINGLTFGGVGSGTTVEYVEVYNNQDDGFEWFGGTVDTRFLVSAFNGDDSFDYDQGFDGKGQFWFTIQPAENGQGNRAGEHDGGDSQEDATPFATPEIYNVTYIGGGASSGDPDNQAFNVRDNAGGHYANSIFTDFGNTGIEVEDLESGADSRQRLDQGDLTFQNNLWYGFGAGNTVSDFAPQSFVVSYLQDTGNNWAEDPTLRGISRTNDGGLDPRPTGSSSAFSRATKGVPADSFFVETNYLGAFGRSNWATEWTFLARGGFLPGSDTTATAITREGGIGELPTRVELDQNYPNPFNPSTNIQFELDRARSITLTVYDALGQRVQVLVDGEMAAGTHTARFDASGLASGVYYYRLTTGTHQMTRKMLLLE